MASKKWKLNCSWQDCGLKKIAELKARVLTMKSWVPCNFVSLYEKSKVSKVVEREKLVACGTQVLLEHSPGW